MKRKIYGLLLAAGMIIVISFAFKKKAMPPNFEAAFDNAHTAIVAFAHAADVNGDTTGTKAILVGALNYLYLNWTIQQISDNIDNLERNGYQECEKFCDKQYIICMDHQGNPMTRDVCINRWGNCDQGCAQAYPGQAPTH